jgi:predicted nucleic acid-binding Zn ribbon protein
LRPYKLFSDFCTDVPWNVPTSDLLKIRTIELNLYFDSLEQILTQLEQQPGWEKFREYRQLLKCWQNTVNSNTAQHTRPLYIERQVLWVATSSAARAQELFFQRYSLLKKLNQQLSFVLKDIRFSFSHWHQTSDLDYTQQNLFKISKKQKSKINLSNFQVEANKLENNAEKLPQITSPSIKAKTVVQGFLHTVQQNSTGFISCPNCDSPTPIGEIERWNLCHHCVAQKWSQEYRPSTFPESQ